MDAACDIAPLARERLGEVAALERACFSDPWSPAALLSSFESPHAVFLGATGPDGVLLGYALAYCLSGEAEILNLAVAPAARRRGVGEGLLAALLGAAAARGAAVFLLDVRESNAPARALYEKFRFRPVGRRRRYYTRPTEDAIEMQRGPDADSCS